MNTAQPKSCDLDDSKCRK